MKQQQQQSKKQKTRPDEIPAETVTNPGPFDVLSGPTSQNHEGTIFYKGLVLQLSANYRNENRRKGKAEIINQVMTIVWSKGGRFLKKQRSSSDSVWQVMSLYDAKRKLKNSFNYLIHHKDKKEEEEKHAASRYEVLRKKAKALAASAADAASITEASCHDSSPNQSDSEKVVVQPSSSLCATPVTKKRAPSTATRCASPHECDSKKVVQQPSPPSCETIINPTTKQFAPSARAPQNQQSCTEEVVLRATVAAVPVDPSIPTQEEKTMQFQEERVIRLLSRQEEALRAEAAAAAYPVSATQEERAMPVTPGQFDVLTEHRARKDKPYQTWLEKHEEALRAEAAAAAYPVSATQEERAMPVTPGQFDVLTERRTRKDMPYQTWLKKHEGNIYYRGLLIEHSPRYSTASVTDGGEEKDSIIAHILDSVRSKGGRFLELRNNVWRVMKLVDIKTKLRRGLRYHVRDRPAATRPLVPTIPKEMLRGTEIASPLTLGPSVSPKEEPAMRELPNQEEAPRAAAAAGAGAPSVAPLGPSPSILPTLEAGAIVMTPGPFDVLTGQTSLQHEGNLFYRGLVMHHSPRYNHETATRYKEKADIVGHIVDFVRSKGGHFLKGGIQGWKVMTILDAKKKVRRSLRHHDQTTPENQRTITKQSIFFESLRAKANNQTTPETAAGASDILPIARHVSPHESESNKVSQTRERKSTAKKQRVRRQPLLSSGVSSTSKARPATAMNRKEQSSTAERAAATPVFAYNAAAAPCLAPKQLAPTHEGVLQPTITAPIAPEPSIPTLEERATRAGATAPLPSIQLTEEADRSREILRMQQSVDELKSLIALEEDRLNSKDAQPRTETTEAVDESNQQRQETQSQERSHQQQYDVDELIQQGLQIVQMERPSTRILQSGQHVIMQNGDVPVEECSVDRLTGAKREARHRASRFPSCVESANHRVPYEQPGDNHDGIYQSYHTIAHSDDADEQFEGHPRIVEEGKDRAIGSNDYLRDVLSGGEMLPRTEDRIVVEPIQHGITIFVGERKR